MKRVKNVLHWTYVMVGFPLSYVWLPISCCIRNPIALTVHDDVDVNTFDEKMLENVLIGCYGVSSIACCFGCCFGECGKKSPAE